MNNIIVQQLAAMLRNKAHGESLDTTQTTNTLRAALEGYLTKLDIANVNGSAECDFNPKNLN